MCVKYRIPPALLNYLTRKNEQKKKLDASLSLLIENAITFSFLIHLLEEKKKGKVETSYEIGNELTDMR